MSGHMPSLGTILYNSVASETMPEGGRDRGKNVHLNPKPSPFDAHEALDGYNLGSSPTHYLSTQTCSLSVDAG